MVCGILLVVMKVTLQLNLTVKVGDIDKGGGSGGYSLIRATFRTEKNTDFCIDNSRHKLQLNIWEECKMELLEPVSVLHEIWMEGLLPTIVFESEYISTSIAPRDGSLDVLEEEQTQFIRSVVTSRISCKGFKIVVPGITVTRPTISTVSQRLQPQPAAESLTEGTL